MAGVPSWRRGGSEGGGGRPDLERRTMSVSQPSSATLRGRRRWGGGRAGGRASVWGGPSGAGAGGRDHLPTCLTAASYQATYLNICEGVSGVRGKVKVEVAGCIWARHSGVGEGVIRRHLEPRPLASPGPPRRHDSRVSASFSARPNPPARPPPLALADSCRVSWVSLPLRVTASRDGAPLGCHRPSACFRLRM